MEKRDYSSNPIEDEGIVLEKTNFREYDERLLLFTKTYGKISAFAYGVKSSRSKRRAILSSGGWLRLKLLKQKKNLLLQDAKVKQLIFHKEVWSEISTKDYIFFYAFLRKVIKFIPYNKPFTDLFYLFKILALPQMLKLPLLHKHFLFTASFLKLMGLLPNLLYCEKCFKDCSIEYLYAPNDGFYGMMCLPLHRKNQQQAIRLTKPSLSFLTSFSNAFEKNKTLLPHVLLQKAKQLSITPPLQTQSLIRLFHQILKNYQVS